MPPKKATSKTASKAAAGVTKQPGVEVDSHVQTGHPPLDTSARHQEAEKSTQPHQSNNASEFNENDPVFLKAKIQLLEKALLDKQVAEERARLLLEKEEYSKATAARKSKAVEISDNSSSPHEERRNPRNNTRRRRSPSKDKDDYNKENSPSVSSHHRRGGRDSSLDRKIDDMQRKYEQLMGVRTGSRSLHNAGTTPLTRRVREAPLPRRFRLPTLRSYNGTADPFDHIHSFTTMMDLLAVDDEILCRAFATTLDGSARKWYNRLPVNSIDSFKEFSRRFCSNFASSRKIDKSSASLMAVKQEKGETLKDFLARFNEEQLHVQDLDDAIAMVALNNGITHRECSWDLAAYPPRTYQELLERAQHFARAEENYRAKRGDNNDRWGHGKDDRKRKNPDDKDSKSDLRGKIDQKRSKTQRDKIPTDVRPRDLPKLLGLSPLNTSMTQILMEIKDKVESKELNKVRNPTREVNLRKSFTRRQKTSQRGTR